MTNIEAVIFDAGGVLHESNTAVTADLVKELGVSKETLAQIWAEQIPLLGSGKIDEAEFWNQVSKAHGLRNVEVSEDLLGRAFTKELKPFPEVQKIAHYLGERGITTAVLSNTIEPHARALREAGLYEGFNAVILSHEVGLRKPEREIYDYALGALGAKADRTIFIDDDPENIEAARAAGMHGIIFSNPEQLRDSLKQYIPEIDSED